MSLTWKRPENVSFPQVWLKFKAKDFNSDNLVEYRVQDLPHERYNEAIDYMCTEFLVNEPMCMSLGLANDEHSVIESRDLWKLVMNQNIVLACFKERSDEIIGINLVAVALKEEQNDKYVPEAEKLRIIFKANKICDEGFDAFEHYNVDKYMTAFGLSVNSKYRGRRIGEYFLRARIPLAKAIGVPLISGGFSAIASQKLATRAGYEFNHELTYYELAEKDPICVFPGMETISMKIMSFKL